MKKLRMIHGLLLAGILFNGLHCGIGTMRDQENDMNVMNVSEQGDLTITQENGFVVATMNLAGFNKEDIAVHVKGNVLWVIAKHTEKKQMRDKNIHSKRVRQHSVEEMETLPCKVNAAKMEWELSRDGILTVTIPKA